MNNYKNTLGPPPQEKVYEKYIDKYYIVHPIGTNEHFVGKIKKIDIKRGGITLNPYFKLDYNRKIGENLYNLVNEDLDISWDLTKITFERTTEESIFHNCYLSNKERIEKRKSESKNKRKRTKREKKRKKN